VATDWSLDSCRLSVLFDIVPLSEATENLLVRVFLDFNLEGKQLKLIETRFRNRYSLKTEPCCLQIYINGLLADKT
jgi:hypothetical protein